MAYRDFILAPIDTVPVPELAVLESARFGLRTSRVHVGPQTSCSAIEVVRAVAADDSDLVILRYPADRIDWYATLVRESEYRVIYSETMLLQTIDLPSSIVEPSIDDGFWFRSIGDEADVAVIDETWASVSEILSEGFAGHRAHFRSNPYLPDVPLAQIYIEWLSTIIEAPGGRVLTWYVDDEAVGVMGFEWYDPPAGPRTAEVHLIALRPKRLRMYDASRAVLHAHELLLADGVQRSVTVVQSHNLYPITSLLNINYMPFLSAVTLHLVHPRVVQRSRNAV